MFELWYEDLSGGMMSVVKDEKKVSYSSIGVSVESSDTYSMVIPWARIRGIIAPTESVKLLMEYTAFGS